MFNLKISSLKSISIVFIGIIILIFTVYLWKTVHISTFLNHGLDMDTTRINKKYSYNKKNIYYSNNIIPKAHVKSFIFLQCDYSRDKKYIFYKDSIIKDADPKTFKIGLGGSINCSFAQDKKYYYNNGEIIHNKNEFNGILKPSDSIYAVDDTSIYALVQRPTGHKYYKIENSDADTFEIIDTPRIKQYLAKDRNNIYYHGNIVEGADPKSFELIPNTDFAKDNENLFFNNKMIKNSDPKTFELLDHESYAKDRNNIYHNGSIIEGADIKSFEFIKIADPKTFKLVEQGLYVKDINNVYFRRSIIENADPKSFELIRNTKFGKDNKNVFYETNMLENADPKTFEVLELNPYAKDINNVYYGKKRVVLADPQSFIHLNHYYAMDNRNIFCNGEISKNIDKDTFIVDGSSTAHDENYRYEWCTSL